MSAPQVLSAPLRVLVVDDEPAARRGIKLLLESASAVNVVGEAGDGPEAVRQIEVLEPYIVFLDVQMPSYDGFEVMKRVAATQLPAVIFVTAYDEHALRAFDVSAVDYLLKPYEDSRFNAALARAAEEVRRRRAGDLGARLERLIAALERSPSTPPAPEAAGPGGLADRILIKSSGELHFIKTEEIDWIEAEGDYMKFHAGGRAHLLRETMARLESRLDPRRFIRIHRSTIVNVDRVRKMSPSFAGEYAVVLNDGTKLRLSRGYQDRLQEILRSAL